MTYGEAEIWLYTFITTALDESSDQSNTPDALSLGKDSGTHWITDLVDHKDSMDTEKSMPMMEIKSWSSSL